MEASSLSSSLPPYATEEKDTLGPKAVLDHSPVLRLSPAQPAITLPPPTLPPNTSFQESRVPPSYEEATPDPPTHSPPPVLQFPRIQGYEDVNFTRRLLLAPHRDVNPVPLPSHVLDNLQQHIPHLDENAARDALLCHVAQNHCFGLSAAKNAKIHDIIPHSSFHYTLETFTEQREVVWMHEPYTGPRDPEEDDDDQMLSGVLEPWDIVILPQKHFQDGNTSVEIEGSSRIRSCHDCIGLGRRRCWSCYGNGQTRCPNCGGSGHPGGVASPGQPPGAPTGSCIPCAGLGRRRCTVCLGAGQLTCKTCCSRGKLRLWLRLFVDWRCHRGDYVVERSALPDHLLRLVSGREAWTDEGPSLAPITFFPDDAVNHASKELIENHIQGAAPHARILAQRHKVRLIPVYQVAYEWRGYGRQFFVYGFENQVYAERYPQSNCCGLPAYCPLPSDCPIL